MEWKPCAEVPCSESTQIGSLQCLVVHKHEDEYAWHVLVALDVLGSLTWFPLLGANGHRSPTLDAAKSAAEKFARTWIAAQAAALGDGWISVEERLPEEYIRVLCRLTIGAGGTEGGWAVGSYAREFGWMTDGIPPQERHHYTTTHWRSLPPLPVAEVEE